MYMYIKIHGGTNIINCISILTLRGLMSHTCTCVCVYVTFDLYTVGSAILALRSTPSVCNWCQDKPIVVSSVNNKYYTRKLITASTKI